MRALELTDSIAKKPERLLANVIEEQAEARGRTPALLSDGHCITYTELAGLSNQCTRWTLHEDLGKRAIVCLLMPNRPEYFAIWLGISRTGCTVALVNSNLTGLSLSHSIDLVAPQCVIVAAELVDRLISALPNLAQSSRIWVVGSSPSQFNRFDTEIDRHSTERVSALERPAVTIEDRAVLIYTSGTTGLPKAANISHGRLMQWSHWFAGMVETTPKDRLYNCLPMYHSIGGIVATGSLLAVGGSVVIREHFSASQFWDDIARWECTLFQYIGEVCRYLLNSPRTLSETQHQIRMCCGNGLRLDIWNEFKDRFRIPKILEFYAATEGKVSFFNVEGMPGAIGRIPPYLAHRFPAALIRLDFEREEPARNEQGLCTRVQFNECGEAVGLISESSSPGNRFEGYTDSKESRKKVLHNVFEQGDAWFRTGDLMRRDEHGYFYFVDRIGDTFRWKGENVSTTQVAEVICTFPGIRHANVYGVPVPCADGKAGMARIVCDQTLELTAFRAHLCNLLPEYAQPLFLCICDELEVTSTFKYTKYDIVKEGYAASSADNIVYFNDRHSGAYTLFDTDLYTRLQRGEVRL